MPEGAWPPPPAVAPWSATCAGSGHSPATTRDVVDLVRQGDPDAVRIVTAAGRALGDVLSTAVSLLNPDVVVIGGDIALAHEPFMLGVRERVLSRSQPLATAKLAIAPSVLGDRAGITGAAAMLADAVFSSTAVDAGLGLTLPPSRCRSDRQPDQAGDEQRDVTQPGELLQHDHRSGLRGDRRDVGQTGTGQVGEAQEQQLDPGPRLLGVDRGGERAGLDELQTAERRTRTPRRPG